MNRPISSDWSRLEQGRLFVLMGMLLTVILVWVPAYAFSGSAKSDCACLRVHFLDVGQGDAILIQTPDGVEALVDGGADAAILRELSATRSYFDRSIDLVVATHPDADHIGGLVDVLARYDIKTILETENGKETSVTTAFARAAKNEQANLLLAEAGQVIALGASTTLHIFSPTGDETNWESNTASIVLKVVYGDTSFMLTGDAPIGIEDYLVDRYGTQLDSDVLKLGHHGSKTSSSDLWLDAVSPKFAVVSAGIDNRYGHPHQEVMARVFARDIETSHTGTDGTIIFLSDGEKVWRE